MTVPLVCFSFKSLRGRRTLPVPAAAERIDVAWVMDGGGMGVRKDNKSRNAQRSVLRLEQGRMDLIGEGEYKGLHELGRMLRY